MENILVSACLLGIGCRYDGEHKADERIIALGKKYNLIPFCPEIYGGLSTPRVPSERVGTRVMMKDGRDVTENYIRGAEEAYRLCVLFGITKAVLKEKSPSCGMGKIYDGTFSGILTDGNGVTAEYLVNKGIEVIGENDVEKKL